jgi:hypothetical protein
MGDDRDTRDTPKMDALLMEHPIHPINWLRIRRESRKWNLKPPTKSELGNCCAQISEWSFLKWRSTSLEWQNIKIKVPSGNQTWQSKILCKCRFRMVYMGKSSLDN